MKRWAIGSIAFVAALLIGTVVSIGVGRIMGVIAYGEQFDPKEIQAIDTTSLERAEIPSDHPPLFDPTINYPKTLPVKLLFPGEFHSDEVPYRSGEKWLGLFRDGKDDRLMPAAIRIGQIKNPALYDTEVNVLSAKRALFLLKGAEDLNVGPVITIFENFEGEARFDLTARKSFGKGGTFWWLWVENPGEGGFPKKGSALMLRQSGHEALTLRTLPSGCDDCSWTLLWVGDLDNDSRLDFLIDVTDHYNVRQPTLFLSSKEYAIYASFRGVGC